MADLNKLAELDKLAGFERIKNIKLVVDPFTIENDLLTPKMTLKRHLARKKFEKELKELYDEIQ